MSSLGRRTRLALLAALLLLTVAPSASCDAVSIAPEDAGRRDAGGPDAGVPEELDAAIAHHMAVGGIPGLAAAIVNAEGVLWTGTYGFADVDRDIPVDDGTLFIQASISKTVLAVRVMQLVEGGQLDLDADVNDYLPYSLRHPDYPDVAITTRMLMSHVSGLVDDFIRLAEVTTEDDDPTVTLAEFSEGYAVPGGSLYSESHWGREPGTRRAYCNAAYGVLGHVVEAASGEDFRAQTEAQILTPLGMPDAGWFLADVDLSRVAVPTDWSANRFVTRPHNGFAFYPASSFRVSVRELSRYARMLLARGSIDGTQILELGSVDELLQIQYPDISSRQALTFSERVVADQTYIGHSGSTFGGSTQLLLSRDRAFALILMTNSDAYVRERIGLNEGGDAMERILERLDREARLLSEAD